MLRLPELQRAFLRAIASPRVDDGLVFEVRGDDRLGAGGRLDVYARMYRARLVDVLREDYSRVALLLGDERFAAAAGEYIAAHPSTHPSLRWFGRDFASFLDEMAPTDVSPYTADLARLEWARLAVFDAPDAAPLDMDALRAIPIEAWTDLRFRLVPAVAMLRVDWPVHRIWNALQAQATASAEWQAEETWLRVWRQDATVYQATMDEIERTALPYVQRGDDFALLCGGVAGVVPPEEAAGTAAALVVRWIADGILLAPVPDSSPAQ